MLRSSRGGGGVFRSELRIKPLDRLRDFLNNPRNLLRSAVDDSIGQPAWRGFSGPIRAKKFGGTG